MKSNEQYCLEIAHLDIFPVENYAGSNTKILHECINGHSWSAYPTNVLKSKGCPTCNGHYKKDDYNGGTYQLLEKYKDRNTPILHKCNCGHTWKIRPSHVLAGHGCPECANWGFKRNQPAILYYVKLTKDNQTYYKVGVTNRTIEQRFKGEDVNIEVLKIVPFDKGIDAERKEQEILKTNLRTPIKGFLKSGFSELFTEPLEIIND